MIGCIFFVATLTLFLLLGRVFGTIRHSLYIGSMREDMSNRSIRYGLLIIGYGPLVVLVGLAAYTWSFLFLFCVACYILWGFVSTLRTFPTEAAANILSQNRFVYALMLSCIWFWPMLYTKESAATPGAPTVMTASAQIVSIMIIFKEKVFEQEIRARLIAHGIPESWIRDIYEEVLLIKAPGVHADACIQIIQQWFNNIENIEASVGSGEPNDSQPNMDHENSTL